MTGAFMKTVALVGVLSAVVAGFASSAVGRSEVFSQYALQYSGRDSNTRIRISADKAIVLMPFLGQEHQVISIAKGDEWHTGDVVKKTSYGSNDPGNIFARLHKEVGFRVDVVSDQTKLRGKFDGANLWIEGVVTEEVTTMWRGRPSSTRIERRYDLRLVFSSGGDCRVIEGSEVFSELGPQGYRLEMNMSECLKIPSTEP